MPLPRSMILATLLLAACASPQPTPTTPPPEDKPIPGMSDLTPAEQTWLLAILAELRPPKAILSVKATKSDVYVTFEPIEQTSQHQRGQRFDITRRLLDPEQLKQLEYHNKVKITHRLKGYFITESPSHPIRSVVNVPDDITIDEILQIIAAALTAHDAARESELSLLSISRRDDAFWVNFGVIRGPLNGRGVTITVRRNENGFYANPRERSHWIS